MKRAAFVILTLMLGSVLSFAGAGRDNAAGGTSAAKPQPLTILWTRNTIMDGHELIFAELEKKYNIRPELEIRVGGAEGETIVKTRLASGDMSDVFIFNTGSKINDINPERNCVDLSADYGTKVDDLYRASSSVNGKLYSVPVDYSAQGGAIYYK